MGGKLRRRTAPRVTRTTILLVTNGEKTEKSYLEGIRRRVPRDANLSIAVKGENGKEPETIVRNLTRSQGGLDEYDEVWIVVDHDGKDRQGFLDACRKVRGTRMVGIVSTPCFEVWLNAHYERVQKYRDQEDAKRHYMRLTGLTGSAAKNLPKDFPYDAFPDAARRCCLTGAIIPGANEQGPSPSTAVPRLLERLGLLTSDPGDGREPGL